jgi:hypothetical protein
VICPGAVLREAARTPPDGSGGWCAAGLRRWQADLLAAPFGAALDAVRASDPPG